MHAVYRSYYTYICYSKAHFHVRDCIQCNGHTRLSTHCSDNTYYLIIISYVMTDLTMYNNEM